MKKFIILFVFFSCSVEDENPTYPVSEKYIPPKELDLIFCRENPNDCFCSQKIDCHE